MKFWNYISELFLFRWLFDKLNKSNKTQKDNCANTIIRSVDVDEAMSTVSTTNIHNELDSSEESDKLDDLDVFMRNNPIKNNYSDYGSSRLPNVNSSSRYDWNNDYNQSFNDFHEEQDDYDMMDDF